MDSYINLLKHILENGEERTDRTGTGTIGVFGYQIQFDLKEKFPLVTIKRTHWNSIVHELLWFLKGESNIKYLKDNKVSIWDEWATETGELGPVYGVQWRHWLTSDNKHIDQIKTLITNLKERPYSRRHIISAWNVEYLPDESISPQNNALNNRMALPPCHFCFQFHVSNDNRLSCHMNMRSADAFLGVPFNIASYALLTHIIANICDLKVGKLIISFGDLHIYSNHLNQVQEALKREPLELPTLTINKKLTIEDIDKIDINDIILNDYKYHPGIKAPIAI